MNQVIAEMDQNSQPQQGRWPSWPMGRRTELLRRFGVVGGVSTRDDRLGLREEVFRRFSLVGGVGTLNGTPSSAGGAGRTHGGLGVGFRV